MPLLTILQFCTDNGVCRSRAYELLASGELSAVKVGRNTRIPSEAVERWRANLPRYQPCRLTPRSDAGK